ncbi:MAG: cytochrome c [Opitutae bacterium]|jgi:mono/diheme cytochrome c family protein|nr:cytochrome c [Opitutae bacterium]
MSDKINKDSIDRNVMNDEDMVEIHSELNREKHPPTKGFLVAPLIFVFMFGCLIFVCSIQLAHSTNSFQIHPPQDVVELSDEEKELQKIEKKVRTGKKIFSIRCASCHQVNGLGIPNQYPPLDGSEWVAADPELIINVILKGLKGEILVKGEKYGTSAAVNMAAVPINDREIANVATYVRQAWGNDFPEVNEDLVATVREETSAQQDQWVGDALQSLYLNNSAN